MQEKNMTFDAAFSFASKKRPVIFPNMGFQRQLKEFELMLKIKNDQNIDFGKTSNDKSVKLHFKGLGSINVNKPSNSLN